MTSSVVELMERDWNELPKQIRLSREDEGYRVVEMQSGSLFSRSGLSVGDLITDKAIEALRSQQNSYDLPERFYRILSHVSH